MKRYAPLALPFLLACGGPRGTERRLPSGRTVEVLRAGQVRFEKTGETAAVMVFRSHRDPGDKARLDADVQELWNAFRPDVEAKGLRVAILQADCSPKSLLPAAVVSTGYVFERQANGVWQQVPAK